jgi:tetratricopeptide (TPR) repeat protein
MICSSTVPRHSSTERIPGVICRNHGAWTLWCLGYPEQGLMWSHEAVTLAQQIAHPLSLSFALSCTAAFHTFCREWQRAQDRAEATIHLATAQGFPFWIAVGAILRGWALAQQGQAREGIAQIHQGLSAYRTTGAEVLRPYWLALLAEAYGTLGEPEAGLAVLTEALTLTDTTGERWYAPELYRLKGALLLQQSVDNQAEAETCCRQAIAIAQINKQSPGNSVLPPAWLVSGKARGSAPKPATCWQKSMAGSLRDSIRQTSRRPRRCWRNWRDLGGGWTRGWMPVRTRLRLLLPAQSCYACRHETVKQLGHEESKMPPLPTNNLDLLDRVAVAQARQKREQYLRTLDALLTSFGIAGAAASLDEIRAMFAQYEKPDMPTLSSEIEAMREERGDPR